MLCILICKHVTQLWQGRNIWSNHTWFSDLAGNKTFLTGCGLHGADQDLNTGGSQAWLVQKDGDQVYGRNHTLNQPFSRACVVTTSRESTSNVLWLRASMLNQLLWTKNKLEVGVLAKYGGLRRSCFHSPCAWKKKDQGSVLSFPKLSSLLCKDERAHEQ